MEDTDKLWEKLVLKDFKEAKLPHGYDWREFYSVSTLMLLPPQLWPWLDLPMKLVLLKLIIWC